MRRTILLLSVVALLVNSCGGGGSERAESATPRTSASASTTVASPTPSPTTGIRTDYDIPPWNEIVAMYDYDTSEPLDYEVVGEERQKGATVYDVEYQSSGNAVPAWLVIPDGQGPFPVVLYAHGYTGTTGRDWFLPDALALAQDGYAGLLITGPDTRAPYLALGSWDARGETEANLQYVIDLRRALDLLGTLSEIDASRIGFVGYSWGAWAGATLSGLEDGIVAYVLMSGGQGYPCTGSAGPTISCHVADGFAYALGWAGSQWPSSAAAERYLRDTMQLDTIPYVSHNENAAFLLQFSRADEAASTPTVGALLEAAPEPKALRWYEGGHLLGCKTPTFWKTSCDADTEALAFHRAWLEKSL